LYAKLSKQYTHHANVLGEGEKELPNGVQHRQGGQGLRLCRVKGWTTSTRTDRREDKRERGVRKRKNAKKKKLKGLINEQTEKQALTLPGKRSIGLGWGGFVGKFQSQTPATD